MLTKVNKIISFWKHFLKGGNSVKDFWTGEAAAIMHVHDISAITLANKLGWNPKYLSSVLNCKRRPKNAERIVMAALHQIVEEAE
jgi:hypothetical protein